MSSQNRVLFGLFSVIGAVLVAILALPIFSIFLNLQGPELQQTLHDSAVWESIILTLKAAFYSSIFGTIMGVPLAYVLSRSRFRGKNLIESFVDIPVMIPHSAAGIALLSVFGQRFFMGRMFEKIGIVFPGTEWGIFLAMFFVSISYMVNSAKEGFKLIDPRMEQAAVSLGATPCQSFRDITLPLALPSILSGFIMMWARGISEFGAVIILTYHPRIVSIELLERFESFGLAYAKPVSAILIFICLLMFIAMRLSIRLMNQYFQKEEGHR